MSMAAMSCKELQSKLSLRVLAAFTRFSGGQSKAAIESDDFRGFKKGSSEIIFSLSI